MELENLKTSFYKKLFALKNELEIGNYYVCEDKDVFEAIGEKYCFKYNGVTIVDSYEEWLLNDLFGDIIELIEMCYIQDFSLANKNNMIKYAFKELSFDDFINYHVKNYGTQIIPQEIVDELISAKLPEFEAVKIKVKKEMLSMLESMIGQEQSKINLPRIKWKGSKLDLSRLFKHLILKGWVEVPEENMQTKFAHSLANFFDIESDKVKNTDSTGKH